MTGDAVEALLNERCSIEQTVATMRRVLVDNFGIDDPNLSEEAKVSALGLDSLSFVEYAFELEAAMNVKFEDLPRGIATVGDFIRFVHGEVIRQSDIQPASSA